MKKDLIHFSIHCALILGTFGSILYGIFSLYLPNLTMHGKEVVVPNLVGVNKEHCKELVQQVGLHYKIVDSITFNPNFNNGDVRSQIPLAGTEVKEGRMVFVNLNAMNTPLITLPEVVNESMDNARFLLTSKGLKVAVHYEIGENDELVKELKYQNHIVGKGVQLPKYSLVTLVVSKKEDNKAMEY